MEASSRTEAFENGAHAQTVRMKKSVGTSYRRMMVRITARSHGQAPPLRVSECPLILDGKRRGCIKHLQTVGI